VTEVQTIDPAVMESADSGADPTEEMRRPSALRETLAVYGGRVLIFLGLTATWSASVHLGLLSRTFVSTPEDVGQFLVDNFSHEILVNTAATLGATLIAFVLSGAAGVLAGLLLVELPYLKRVCDPYLTAFNSMPRIALGPIFILWFGIGVTSKVALAFSLGFFIVLTSTFAGIRNIDPTLLRLSRSLGCSGWQQFTKITLPWAIPGVFAGLKLALIYSFLGVVTSEMLASKVGLGQLIMYYSGILRMDAVFGILLIMAVCAVILTLIADRIEAALLGSWTEPPKSARA
jgi:NitT/TauT family transport system permease protein